MDLSHQYLFQRWASGPPAGCLLACLGPRQWAPRRLQLDQRLWCHRTPSCGWTLDPPSSAAHVSSADSSCSCLAAQSLGWRGKGNMSTDTAENLETWYPNLWRMFCAYHFTYGSMVALIRGRFLHSFTQMWISPVLGPSLVTPLTKKWHTRCFWNCDYAMNYENYVITFLPD